MKRFMAAFMAGTMLFSQNVFAGTMPEDHWAYSNMEAASYLGLFDMDKYADNITHESGNKITETLNLNNLIDGIKSERLSFDQDFEFFENDSDCITRAEWASMLSAYIDMCYNDLSNKANELGSAAETIFNVPEDERHIYSDNTPNFTDVNDSLPNKAAIDQCYKYGLMVGYADNSFYPAKYITYAEAATTLTNLSDNFSKIMADRGIDIFAFSVYDNEVIIEYLNMIKKAESIIKQADEGTLSSARELDADSEKAVQTYIDALEAASDVSSVSLNANVELSGSVKAADNVNNGAVNINITGDMTFEDGIPEEAAINTNVSLNMPVTDDTEETSDKPTDIAAMDIYIKDGYLYFTNSTNNEKYKMPYLPGSVSETNTALAFTQLEPEASRCLNEYMYRESIQSGSVTENEDGTKTLDIMINPYSLYSAIGFDLNKLIDMSGEDITFTLGDVNEKCTIDNNNLITETNGNVTVFFKYNDISADLDVYTTSDCKYNNVENIDIPDLSDYETLE